MRHPDCGHHGGFSHGIALEICVPKFGRAEDAPAVCSSINVEYGSIDNILFSQLIRSTAKAVYSSALENFRKNNVNFADL
jgi:hypothetical protein